MTTYTWLSHIFTITSNPSPVSLSLATLSQLSRDFSSNRPVGSLEKAVNIATRELPAQSQANLSYEHYDLFVEKIDAANAQVEWLSNFVERNLDWKILKYKQYSDFLKALDSSGRVRMMIEQHQAAKQEDMGNEDAGRPPETLSRTPRNPTRFQRKWELDAIDQDRQPNIQRSWVSKEMSESCTHPLSRDAKLVFECEPVVYFHRLSGF